MYCTPQYIMDSALPEGATIDFVISLMLQTKREQVWE